MIHAQVAVLGGGITGLYAAHRLRRDLGVDAVVVLEASARAGGYVRTDVIDGFVCDAGPNGFVDKEPRMLEWIDALGISSELQRANKAAARRFLLKRGRLGEIDPPPGFFLSPVLTFGAKARLMQEPFVPPKRDDAPESVWDFAARRVGREVADTLVSALVTGVFAGDPKRLSMAHCFPRMVELERKYGSLLKAMNALRKEGGDKAVGLRGTLTSFRTGIGRLTERAAEALGASMQTGFDVEAIETTEGGYRVMSTGGGEVRAENLIVALPVKRAAPLLTSIDHALSTALQSIEHAPVAVVCTAYPRESVRHDMNGFGFLVLPNETQRALGCIWTSSLFLDSAPKDFVFLRTLYGGMRDPKALALSDGDLTAQTQRDLNPILGIRDKPAMTHLFRHSGGIPQYGMRHADVLRAVENCESARAGLWFAGNGYRGVSLNDCVVSADRAATAALKRLGVDV